MTGDYAISDLNSADNNAESISNFSDVEANSTPGDTESNSVLPDREVDSVLVYLQSNSESTDPEPNSPTEEDVKSNADADVDFTEVPLLDSTVDNNIQVQWKSESGRLLLILPTESQVPPSEVSWSEIWQQMKLRLKGGDRFRLPNTPVHLVARDRLLDTRQLQELAESLNEVELQLKSVSTSRRQTAIAAVSSGYSVEQVQAESTLNLASQTAAQPLADALYLQMTVRSGLEIRHPGSVIILGDLNPGGIVVADGDILVWGRLRGIAHAGATGNRECLIMAVQMEPTQLRIADAVARAPETSPLQFFPEVAHITPEGIRISKASDFSRSQLSKI
ncbi:septum site-determining protein MinC [Scytonema hofmannii FACHB-248]|uniref:Probable septum site-determining protein MinC n=1 Tax=Scytonema hofmannii FACHB-248 TaxID=1842502 RepID=A0ABR8GUB9_9CYAN|nr:MULTISPECIES: septum site-determining protein MinC [Nostocales]MBD2606669.1 septum site-determining protein MinC [Scytonema hofmannii FACHB-248]